VVVAAAAGDQVRAFSARLRNDRSGQELPFAPLDAVLALKVIGKHVIRDGKKA
jgi:hypothetical protein